MIITPHRCTHFIEKNFKENINKTCEIKGRCQLISDKKVAVNLRKGMKDENKRRNQRKDRTTKE